MTSAPALDDHTGDADLLRRKFLKWQCRARQMMMRDNGGRPDASVMPELILPGAGAPMGGAGAPMGRIITILNKRPGNRVISELTHMARRTHDPAQIRARAIQFFSASYYQQPESFSDILTATFPPGSPGAAAICAAGTCRLVFDAWSQLFDLSCEVRELPDSDPLHIATMAHNRLFNMALSARSPVLSFAPVWGRCSARP
ncbi:MAG TPA: hypothetical protein ENK41_00030 [Rhodobacteraceae bacterium]|nr:hypothetical protein [Paracoccaceae bacterium]